MRCGEFSLHPLAEVDPARLADHLADPAVLAFLDFDPAHGDGNATALIAAAADESAAGSGARWWIAGPRGAFVGTCGVVGVVPYPYERGEVCFDLAPAWWGQGVMGRILPVLIEYAAEHLGVRRLEALVMVGNHRARRLLLRHGFEQEGHLRQFTWKEGAYRDVWLLARLRAPTVGQPQTIAPPGST